MDAEDIFDVLGGHLGAQIASYLHGEHFFGCLWAGNHLARTSFGPRAELARRSALSPFKNLNAEKLQKVFMRGFIHEGVHKESARREHAVGFVRGGS